MPQDSRRTQAETEVFLTEEYLRFKSLEVVKIQALRERIPDHGKRHIAGPDVFAICNRFDQQVSLGIEITEYQVDQTESGSASVQAREIWERLQHCARKNHDSDIDFLKYLEVSIRLNKSDLPKKQDIEQLAGELIHFLRNHQQQYSSQWSYFCPARQSKMADSPIGFQLLQRHINRIGVYRTDDSFENRRWQFSDAAHIGVVPGLIAGRITSKSKQQANYSTDVDELWLLICASGTTSSSAAGPESVKYELLESSDIQSSIEGTAFHRIIFWERVRRWDAILK